MRQSVWLLKETAMHLALEKVQIQISAECHAARLENYVLFVILYSVST